MREEQVSILVVEDDSIVAKDLQTSLENFGYNVASVVSTGEEAIEKADQYVPDCLC